MEIWPARPTNLNLVDLRPVEAFVWNALDRKYVLAPSPTDYFNIKRVVTDFFKFLVYTEVTCTCIITQVKAVVEILFRRTSVNRAWRGPKIAALSSYLRSNPRQKRKRGNLARQRNFSRS